MSIVVTTMPLRRAPHGSFLGLSLAAVMGLSSCVDASRSTAPAGDPVAVLARTPAVCPALPAGTSSLLVNPNTVTIGVGSTGDLQVTNQSGAMVDDCNVKWTSADTRLATVSATGLVTALKAGGPIAVRATAGTKPSMVGSTAVTLSPIKVGSVVVPATSLVITSAVTLLATVKGTDGSTLTNRIVRWSSASPSVATVDSMTGKVTGVGTGAVAISAISEGVRGTATVTVGTVGVQSVTVSPATGSLAVGQTLQLSAVVKDGAGNVMTNQTIAWTSSSTANATVSASGLVTAIATSATVQITATTGGVNGSAIIAVTEPLPGGEIVYQRDPGDWINNPTEEIWIVRPDGSGDTRVTNNANIDQRPVLSPDGSRIAFSSDVGKPFANDGILIMNRDGSNRVALTPEYAGNSTGPAWSPDGKKIAFYSNLNTVDGQIYRLVVMNADGSNKVILSANDGRSRGNPAWSRDGNKIYHYIYEGQHDLYSMNADGTNVSRITNTSELEIIEAGAVSPDGMKLVFTVIAADGNRDIYVMNIDGTGKVRLTYDASDDQMASWSPDGTRIAFASTRSGTSQIWIMNADGSNPVRLNTGTDWAYYPYWR